MKGVILVTGSSRGIGKEVPKLAHKQGYQVSVHDKIDSEELNTVYSSLSCSIKTFFDVADKRSVLQSLEEIAPLVLFLASDDASYITGSRILIDGGYILKGK